MRSLLADLIVVTPLDHSGIVEHGALRVEQIKAEDYEDLDPAVQAAIDEAEAEYEQGGGIPLDEAFARLREKFLTK